MSIESLEIQHLRNIQHTRLQPSPGLNLVTGPNASGKTSLLEAINLALTGRSFRTHRLDQAVSRNEENMLVLVDLKRSGKKALKIGFQRSKGTTLIKAGGEKINKSTDLLQYHLLQTVHPDLHDFLDQGPKERRHFLDWGVFHVKHQYLQDWRAYHHSLRQRNILLRKEAQESEIRAWNRLLLEQGIQLHQARVEYLESLQEWLRNYCQQLMDLEPVFNYRYGWDSNSSFEEILEDSLEKDRQRGFTQSGPHRADIQITVEGTNVQQLLSRGQQKLLISALYLAQFQHWQQQRNQRGTLLIDDLPAELDVDRRKRLIDLLRDMDCQIFITSTEPEQLDISSWPEARVFHVKQVEISSLN